MEWYLSVLKKYAVFSGRARRKEFWMYSLINFLIAVALAFVDGLLGTSGLLGGLYALAVLIPGLAVSVRRLHDTGRSGWWMLLMFLPLIGAIVLLVFWAQASKEENSFGANPKPAVA